MVELKVRQRGHYETNEEHFDHRLNDLVDKCYEFKVLTLSMRPAPKYPVGKESQLTAILRALSAKLGLVAGSLYDDLSLLGRMLRLSNAFERAEFYASEKSAWCREVCQHNKMARRIFGAKFYNLFAYEMEVVVDDWGFMVSVGPDDFALFGEELARFD